MREFREEDLKNLSRPGIDSVKGKMVPSITLTSRRELRLRSRGACITGLRFLIDYEII